MSDILSLTEFETAFQALQFRLTLKLSARLKTRFLGEFCIILQSRKNPVIHHSYYQEILPHLQQYLTPESLTYHPIKFILALHDTLNYIRTSGVFEVKDIGFDACCYAVKNQAVSSFIYLSEFKDSVQLACIDEPVEVELDYV